MQIFLAQRTHHVETFDFSQTGSRYAAGSRAMRSMKISAITLIDSSRLSSTVNLALILIYMHEVA